METHAVVLQDPKGISLQYVPLIPASTGDAFVQVHHSGIPPARKNCCGRGGCPRSRVWDTP